MIKTDWTSLKALVTSKKTLLQFIETSNEYQVMMFDGPFEAFCIIFKSTPAGADQEDFETNYKSTANKPLIPRDASGREIKSLSPFTDASGFRFRGASFSGSCVANSSVDIDYQITQERYINGGRLLIDNIGNDDKMTFQVVDKDNVLGYGAGAVLDEFIKDYFIPTSGNLEVRLDYPAKIIAGLYLRLKYTSTHASGCSIKCNLYLHWKAA